MSEAGDEWPPDLRALEEQLAGRRVEAGGAAFKLRVLGAMNAARRAPGRQPYTWWQAAAAAAVVLWMNVSFIAATETELRVGDPVTATERRESVRQMRELLPELTEREAERQLLLLQARAHTLLAPLPRSGRAL